MHRFLILFVVTSCFWCLSQQSEAQLFRRLFAPSDYQQPMSSPQPYTYYQQAQYMRAPVGVYHSSQMQLYVQPRYVANQRYLVRPVYSQTNMPRVIHYQTMPNANSAVPQRFYRPGQVRSTVAPTPTTSRVLPTQQLQSRISTPSGSRIPTTVPSDSSVAPAGATIVAESTANRPTEQTGQEKTAAPPVELNTPENNQAADGATSILRKKSDK